VRGAAGPDDAVADAKAFGFPAEVIEQLRAASAPMREMDVWPDNWPIIHAFTAISTQWRTAPIGMGAYRYLGLDYTAAKAGLELAGITVTTDQWKGVRVMERAATIELNGGEG
jgi:hypothetical protein